MKLYYMIWVAGIKKMQSIPANRGQWKSQMMIYMSIAMALNFAVIISFIQLHVVGYVFYDLSIDVFPGEKLDNAFSFFILYLIGPVILNYMLIYKNERYELLLVKYRTQNGKLFSVYFLGTLVIAFIYGIFFTPTVN